MGEMKSPDEFSNTPTKITMKINKIQVVFESEWNDGVYVRAADFDKNDNCIDIYITETGTDIQAKKYADSNICSL
jgi:hypothetical protein